LDGEFFVGLLKSQQQAKEKAWCKELGGGLEGMSYDINAAFAAGLNIQRKRRLQSCLWVSEHHKSLVRPLRRAILRCCEGDLDRLLGSQAKGRR
jgi:hypothetical protein